MKITDQLQKYLKWRRGIMAFTLIELLILLAVVAILLTTLIPRLRESRCRASLVKLQTFIRNLNSKIATTPDSVNPESEKTNLDNLIAEVKKDCNKDTVSESAELQSNLDQLIKSTNAKAETDGGAWNLLKASVDALKNEFFGEQ